MSEGLKRATVIAKMRKAARAGQSASTFIREARSEGLSYRRTTMLADWRSVNDVEKKDGAFRFVRKDRFPAVKSMAEVEWKLSQEYMFKVKVQSRTSPGEKPTERFVNIMSDVPLTPQQVEAQVTERWGEWELYAKEEMVGLQVWTAVHKSMQ